jgi:hypothetical protein
MENSPISVSNRDQLLITYACAEWDSALTHLRALREVGCRVPEEVWVDMTAQFEGFAVLVANVMDWEEWSTDRAVSYSRSYLAKHQEELEALLSERVGV